MFKSLKLSANLAIVDIYLTYDYELFFGSDPGSVEKCLLEPTNELLDICEKENIPMTFFVDVGYLIKLQEFKKGNPSLEVDQNAIYVQIDRMKKLNCSIQLHIHPHWEKSRFEKGKWIIVTDKCYKLADFTKVEIREIIIKYKSFLDELIGVSTTAFRAGGWCIQPFNLLSETFKELNITVDSSVFSGGKFESKHYAFDFTSAPKKSKYRFESDESKEELNGFFTEFPISSYRYSPLFYWKLYILGRLFPIQHKMIGDGHFLAQPGRKKQVLTSFTWNHASTDGYYASKMEIISKKNNAKGMEEMVFIGHPKSMTRYSFKKLKKFILLNKNKYDFKVLGTEICN